MTVNFDRLPARRTRRPRPKPPLEWFLQAAFVAELHRLEAMGWPLTCAASMNAARRTVAEALRCRAMGLTAGEPDLRLYGHPGRILLIEFKRPKGRLSEDQDKRIDRLIDLGFCVLTLTLTSEDHARAMALDVATRFCDPAGRLL